MNILGFGLSSCSRIGLIWKTHASIQRTFSSGSSAYLIPVLIWLVIYGPQENLNISMFHSHAEKKKKKFRLSLINYKAKALVYVLL